jgi:hypothetical protein
MPNFPKWFPTKYCLHEVLIVITKCAIGLLLVLIIKLYFHNHVEYIYSHALKLLGLIRSIIYNFFFSKSFIYCIYYGRDWASAEAVAWNNLPLKDFNKLVSYWNYFFDPEDGGDMFIRNVGRHSYTEKVWKFVLQSIYSFLFFRNNDSVLNPLNFRTFYCRLHLDTSFRVNVLKHKFDCCSSMDAVGFRIPT